MLGTLPTFQPLQAVLSAALITVAAAAALLTGQRGRGPFASALRTSRSAVLPTDVLKWTIFVTIWMVAVVWNGAITICIAALGFSHVSAAWLNAACVLSLRWAWLCKGSLDRNATSAAMAIYPASHDAALTVGLVAGESSAARPTTEASNSTGLADAGALPSLHEVCGALCCPLLAACPLLPAVDALTSPTFEPLCEKLWTASKGLCALAGAWLGTVALQGSRHRIQTSQRLVLLGPYSSAVRGCLLRAARAPSHLSQLHRASYGALRVGQRLACAAGPTLERPLRVLCTRRECMMAPTYEFTLPVAFLKVAFLKVALFRAACMRSNPVLSLAGSCRAPPLQSLLRLAAPS